MLLPNHRVVGVGSNLKGHPAPTPCQGQGYLPQDQVAQSPITDAMHCGCLGWIICRIPLKGWVWLKFPYADKIACFSLLN